MNTISMSTCKAVLTISLLGLSTLLAEDGVPNDVQELLNQYQEQKREGISRLNSTYIEHIEVLEKKYTSQGDLDAAVAVQQAIDELAAEIESLQTSGKDRDQELREYLLSKPFQLFFSPPRSKLVTFLHDGMIGQGGNSSEHSWGIVDGELTIFSAEKEVGFVFSYEEGSGRLNASETPHRWKVRNAYLVPAE